MILPPWSMWLRITSREHRDVRLWLPLFLLWLLLLPFMLFALGFAIIADLVLFVAGRRYHHYTLLLFGCLRLVAETRGMDVRVNDKNSIVNVAIR